MQQCSELVSGHVNVCFFFFGNDSAFPPPFSCSYSDSEQLIVEGELTCHLWPQEHLNVDIVEASSNDPIGSEVETTITTTSTIPDILEGIGNTDININIEEFIGSAASRSTRHSIVWVVCATLITVYSSYS